MNRIFTEFGCFCSFRPAVSFVRIEFVIAKARTAVLLRGFTMGV